MASKENAIPIVLQTLGCSDEIAMWAALDVCDHGQKSELHVAQDWHRGGAETYILVFELKASDRTKRFVVKACTPFSPAVSIDVVLARWLARRKLLENRGCIVPRLYGAQAGALIEDYIPYELDSFPASEWTSVMISDVLHFADVLSTERFNVMAPFADLRTDGNRVFVIDFGEDLGNPGAMSNPADYGLLARNFVRGKGLTLATE